MPMKLLHSDTIVEFIPFNRAACIGFNSCILHPRKQCTLMEMEMIAGVLECTEVLDIPVK